MILREIWCKLSNVADRFFTDRLKEISGPQKIEAWTKFDFPGRGMKYSPLKWNKKHFSGVDWDQKTKSKGVYKFRGKQWAHDVDEELGNYDFL